MPRYELSDGNSHKFWQIELSGKAFTTTYGRIGSDGQSTTKKHASPDEAQKEHDKLVSEKVRKGYKLVSGKAKAAKAAPKRARKADDDWIAKRGALAQQTLEILEEMGREQDEAEVAKAARKGAKPDTPAEKVRKAHKRISRGAAGPPTGEGDARATVTPKSAAAKALSKKDVKHADLEGADLSGARLAGWDLGTAYLGRANLQGADLSGATLINLRGAKLVDAKLAKAELFLACLDGANLTGANLAGANLEAAMLNRACLRGANLTGAKLSGALLASADLRDVIGLTQKQLDTTGGGNSKTRLPPKLKMTKEAPDEEYLPPITLDGDDDYYGDGDDGDGGKKPWSNYPSRNVYVMTDEHRLHLRRYEGPIYDMLRPRSWPPAGYKGADEDVRLALELAELLKSCVESSDIDSAYMSYVVLPERGSRGKPPKNDKEAPFVFLNADASERKQKDWWHAYMSDEEYRARVAAGERLTRALGGVDREDIGVGYVHSIVVYGGFSATGAHVGVLATRTDT